MTTSLPKTIETVAELEEALSRPTPALVEAMAAFDRDLLILGVGGKMGKQPCLGLETMREFRKVLVGKSA